MQIVSDSQRGGRVEREGGEVMGGWVGGGGALH